MDQISDSPSMPKDQQCPQCGARLNAFATEGHCSACLLEKGLFPSTAQTVAPPLSHLGDYELIQEIARGGMGVVYKARQTELDRVVAVKMILSGQFASAAEMHRFRAEARATAALHHPGIVAIHEVGEHEGLLFYSMDYVEGQNLAQLVRDGPLSATRSAECVREIAEAVHYAHQHGVLHRDLKPSNILIDSDGQPHVTDFGLARQITAGSELTQSGQILGSPSYMSPEQAAARPTGPSTDVYALGAILYELLTGRPPFAAATPNETLTQVLTAEPVAPRLLNPAILRDLETICVKCLDKEPGRRYVSALALAQDLGRHLNHEPIQALPPSTVYRAQKFVRRHRRSVTVAAGMAMLLMVATVVSTSFGLRADRARASAEQAQQELRQRLARSFVDKGTQLVESGDLSRSLLWFMEALGLEQGNAAREEAHRRRIASVLQQCPKLLQLWVHQDSIDSAEFSPDGRWVVTASEDDTARVWDTNTGQPLGAPLQHTGGVRRATFSPSGRQVVTASADGTARVWDSISGQPITAPLLHRATVWYAEFSHDGKKVVTASMDGTGRIWDAVTGQPLTPPLRHKGALVTARFSPDDQRIVTASIDNTACLWNASTGAPVTPSLPHLAWVRDARFSPDGQRLVTASMDHAGRVWETATGKLIHDSIRHRNGVGQAAFSLDGRFIVTTGAGDNTARIWDARTGEAWTSPLLHNSDVVGVSLSPDGRLLLTACADQTARLWDAVTGKPLFPRLTHNSHITAAAFAPDGHRILTASRDHTARLWDIASLDLSFQLLAHTQKVSHFCFSPSGDRVATAAKGTATIWSATNGFSTGRALKHEQGVNLVAFSSDGRKVVTASWDTTARVWDAFAGEPMLHPLAHSTNVSAAAFCSDGTKILTACDDGQARIWDAQTGRLLQSVQHGRSLDWAGFDPEGKRIVTVSHFRDARLWDALTGQPLARPLQHREGVRYAEFSPTGRQVVTCSHDHTAQVWDAATGNPLGRPLQHQASVTRAAFNATGDRVVTASQDGSARVWDAASGGAISPPLRHESWVETAAFSPDSRWVVTASHDASARVWDALTGEPVTPPFYHAFSLVHAAFSPDSRWIATASGDGQVRLWPWRTTATRREDLMEQARLLSGGSLDPTGGYTPLAPDELLKSWRNQRGRSPELFSVTASDIKAWHQRQVQCAELFVPADAVTVAMAGKFYVGTWDDLLPAVRWNAIRFHLDRLIALGPEDPALRQHRWVVQHEADQTAQRGAVDPTVGLMLSAEPPSRQADLLKSLIVTAGMEDPTSLSSVQTVMKTYFASNRPEAAETVLGVLLNDPLAAPAESRLRWEMRCLLGETLLRQSRYVEAGKVLQECLGWFEKNMPGLSPSYIVQGLLGWSLLGQKRYDDSEKYLERAYEGLKKRQVERPSPARAQSIRETAQHLVQLYEAWGKPDQAIQWRQKSE